MKPILWASLICGTALLFGSSALAQVATPAAQGSNSPAASRPVSCTESLILPVGISFQGSPMDPYSTGGGAAVPYSAVEEISIVQTLADGAAIPPRRHTVKIYRDSHGRSRRERPICSQLYEDAEAVLVSIDDPVAGYEYDLDPQNRIAYRYSLKALKASVSAAHENRPSPHMEVTKEPLGSQPIEGLLAVGTRETRRVISADARENERPFTLVVEVWYSPEIKAVVLEKSPSPFVSAALALRGEMTRRLTNIDRAEPDISLFQPPADYKIEDATGTVTINYTNHAVPLASLAQARPEATGKPQNKTAPGSKPVKVRENPRDGLKYVWIPPGTFTMGCSSGDSECFDEEKPAHAVTITKGFWIGQTVVTVGAYKRFTASAGQQMPAAPYYNAGWTNENMPIFNVNWNDAQAYCQWSEGRLPTEAEWEYAARAGSTEARYGPLDEVAWYAANSGAQTHEVAQKRANTFGLYDTLGNVVEWVNDWNDGNYYQNSPSQDPSGPSSGQYRVMRGGSWYVYPRGVRVSFRGGSDPAVRDNGGGVRCVGEANMP
jgi:formylglycine-generating enzyme required for sulfatase activity